MLDPGRVEIPEFTGEREVLPGGGPRVTHGDDDDDADGQGNDEYYRARVALQGQLHGQDEALRVGEPGNTPQETDDTRIRSAVAEAGHARRELCIQQVQ